MTSVSKHVHAKITMLIATVISASEQHIVSQIHSVAVPRNGSGRQISLVFRAQGRPFCSSMFYDASYIRLLLPTPGHKLRLFKRRQMTAKSLLVLRGRVYLRLADSVFVHDFYDELRHADQKSVLHLLYDLDHQRSAFLECHIWAMVPVHN